MDESKRRAVGFLVAPVAPGVLLYAYGVVKGYGAAALVGPLLLVPLAYLATIVIGIPVHRYLDRKGVRGLTAYLFSGGFIGASFDLIGNLPGIYMYKFLPLSEIVVATMYAAISAAVFWSLAVRGTLPKLEQP